MNETRRESVVLRVAGQKVFGMVHRPSGTGVRKRPGIVILHGFLGSKDQPHRIFVTLAEALARTGMVALRIDFRGRGDSEGESVDILPESDIADARAAVDWLARQDDVDNSQLSLLGMSWGGTVAAIVAGRDQRIGKVVLWGASIERMNWKPNLFEARGRLVADVFGNLVGKEFYQALDRLDPPAEVKNVRGPCFLLRGSADEAVSQEAFARTAQALAGAKIPAQVSVIQGADHALMRHDWEQEAIERTVRWLGRSS